MAVGWDDALLGLGLSGANNLGAGISSGLFAGINYKYNEKAAENADRRTRALYNDLYSIPAQMKQLKDAGLSPSIYASGGLSGMSGQSGAMGGGASGNQPQYFSIDPLTASQIKVNESLENKNNADAERTRGEGKRGSAEVANLIADTIGKEAATKYRNLQTEIESETKASTINEARAKAEIASQTALKLTYDIISSQAAAEIAEKSKKFKIEQEELKADNYAKDLLLKDSQIKLNNSEVNRIAAELGKWAVELTQGYIDLAIKSKDAETRRQFNGIMENYYQAQIKLGYDKLNFDKEKLSKEMKLAYMQLLETFIDHSFSRAANMLVSFIPH